MNHNMVDLFYMYAVSGGCASRYDWLNHVSGARELMHKAGTPFQPCACAAAHVRHPESFHYLLELLPESEEVFTAFDESEPGLMLHLTRRDVTLIELPPVPFGKWLMRLLGLPIPSVMRLLCHDRLIHCRILGADFYISAAASVEDLREHLVAMNAASPALCLILNASLEKFECVARMLGEAAYLSCYSIHEFVEYRNGAYVYTNSAPLLDIIKEHAAVHPEAEFLPRPAGCSWHQLHIQIRSITHYDALSVESDLLEAWYEDAAGKIIGSRKTCRISAWGHLCRNGKATWAYIMLKLFAAYKGRLSADQSGSIKNANVVRTHLRKFLCRQFGYTEEETPIVEETPKSRVFRTEFSISFADSKSDPLADARSRARTRLRG